MPAIGNASSFSARLPPTPKPPPAKPAPVANVRTGNNPRGVAIAPVRTPPPSPPASTRTGNNPRGVAITQPKAPAAPSSPRAKLTQKIARNAPFKQTHPVAAERTLRQSLARLWQGPDQPFLVPLDPIARSVPQTVQRLMARGQFNQDFADLQQAGLLPADAKQPALTFPARGAGPKGELSYEHNGTVFLSPLDVTAAANVQSPLHAWSQETPIHEIAHALQLPQVLQNKPLREGGAQAYADAAVPAVLGPIPTNDTNYTGYVNQVRANQGVPWFMRRQFR